ncbi:chalcone isomerase family protein [Dechloromonas agitata]|uniref:chalcone isomerase family protein n=1 Tax=Dechloromonas agitata TaxID=73030 RepID=UPI0004831B8F|nr:chalcone isomerase family protein [Dechloromonas agitata]MDE1545240.1 chalcone isomerase family protein [Dechloromonas agitata]
MITSTSVRRAALIAALMAVPGLHAAEVAGVRVADSVKVGNNELVLNGAGLRSKLFIKVYVGALYVGQKAATPAAIYDSATPRRMVLRLLRDLDADSLHSALDEGLRNNHTPAELSEMQAQAEQLAGIMKAIGKVREGDTISIDFSSEGVVVSQNGEVRGKVAGAGFAKALLKVWLGEKPADASLKKALLGS